ncbi:MAG: DUF4199 domain-containing protein [Bacteroidales bacterium]|nr:DUF4199 domain-containing protein [Bacteroidales bacterium]MBR5532302.1 DUF4199 domain-containing protein [Bacteroidales bacterium]
MEQDRPKGVIRYSMEYAIYFGLLLIIKTVLASFVTKSMFVGMLMFFVVPMIPVVGFILTKRFRDVSGFSKFANIFLFGLTMYFFASLLSGLFDYLYYQYINPEFFQEQISSLNGVMQELINSGSITDGELIEELNKEMPSTPIQTVIQGIWGTFILGAIYSLFLALILFKRQSK